MVSPVLVWISKLKVSVMVVFAVVCLFLFCGVGCCFGCGFGLVVCFFLLPRVSGMQELQLPCDF